MEERRQIVNQYVQAGLLTKIALPLAGLSRSTYYYKPTGNKGGKTPSTHTYRRDGSRILNNDLVALMISILEEPFIDYGVKRMTLELHNRGFVINKKKVYRLMKESKLVYPKRRKVKPDRQFVKFTVPDPEGPFQTIEIDIKYVYIQGDNKTAYLVTAIDTFSRIALEWTLDYHMKAYQVAKLIKTMVNNIDQIHCPDKFFIRTDNGPQFIAKTLKECIKGLSVNHEFINPGTPQQNGHIESFHSIVSKLVVTQYEFESLDHAKKIFTQFYEVYNNKRIMTVLAGKSPKEFHKLWCEGRVLKTQSKKGSIFILREKPDKCLGSPLQDSVWHNQSMVVNKYISKPLVK
jgi:transposase InsO family protein